MRRAASARSNAITCPSDRRTTATTPARKCGFTIVADGSERDCRPVPPYRPRAWSRSRASAKSASWCDDLAEPTRRAHRVAGAVEQIGEHVPLAEVVVAHLLRRLLRRLHQRDRLLELAAVGVRPCDDDAGLRHHLVRR